MKLFRGILACLVALPLAFAALDKEASAVLGSLPKCAAKCLVNNILASTCDLEDIKCTCENAPLQAELEKCVLAACTVREALYTKNTTMALCGAPVRNDGSGFLRLNDVMGTFSGVFVLIRFATKIGYRIPLGIDDLFVGITMVFSIPCIVINSYGLGPAGLGTDIWTLTPTQITDFGRWFYVIAILYFVVQTSLKLTLIFFYLRIFPSTGVRRVLWGTVAFIAAYGLAFILVTIFQCQPINHFWVKWDGEHKGKCASINGITFTSAAINIAMDFWILGIPLSQLKGMNLDWRKKIGVGMMFSVGTFVTIMSIFRLYACIVAGISHTNNASWEYLAMSKWSTIELNVGIWCACMPTLRVLLVRLFPKVLGTSKRYINYGSHKSDQQGGSSREDPNRPRTRTDPLGTSATASKSARSRADPLGITLDTTFEVEYGAEDDETHLVHMKDIKNLKTANSYTRSEDSI